MQDLLDLSCQHIESGECCAREVRRAVTHFLSKPPANRVSFPNMQTPRGSVPMNLP